MKYSTPEKFKPRTQTLDIIRQIAYTYRTNINQAVRLN